MLETNKSLLLQRKHLAESAMKDLEPLFSEVSVGIPIWAFWINQTNKINVYCTSQFILIWNHTFLMNEVARLFKSIVARDLICFLCQLSWVYQALTFLSILWCFSGKHKSIQTQNSWEIQQDKSPDWGGSEADVGHSGNRRILHQEVAEMEKWVTGVSC